ncbi:uromodulin-like 1 isoform X1 [Misgurnus anguillicaudatus]|uniref:uromodulin-like 1 isoform X1 n=1 Tax=Misgurnus anguillicaudatus TaxID=75329 RepID=UPI003CCFB7E4
MQWVVGTWFITSLLGLGRGHNTLFEGYDRSLSGYHRCSVNESVLVTHVISYPTSYTQKRPCGGWLPWTVCDVTVYQTSYRMEFSNTTKQVMKCCHGYEQVGSHCALSLNRSAEFTSKPGLCPSVTESQWYDANPSSSVCMWDIDCPKRQKCCQNENTYQCSDPLPPGNRNWCFNATITVKTAYELLNMDKGLFNHTRLLHSVVTGALGTNGISVYYLWSWAAGPFTTSSSLQVCSSIVLSLKNISTQLYMLEIIEEVTSVAVEDVDECAVPELNNCSNHTNCNNTEGSYVCICHHGYEDQNPTEPGTVCMAPKVTTPASTTGNSPTTTSQHTTGPTTYTDTGGTQSSDGPMSTSFVDQSTQTNPSSQPSPTCDHIPEITSISANNVTNSTFNVTWTTNNQTGVKFHLVLLHGTTELNNLYITSLHWMFRDLMPGVLYTVWVAPIACENMGNHTEVKVRTDGETLSATARLTNVVYAQYMNDPNNEEYKAFCKNVIDEIFSSLPEDIRQLVVSGVVTINITSLSNGSVIVNFSIVFQPNSNLSLYNVSSALMTSLQSSHVYAVDNSSIHIEDLNECLLGMADCSPWARCNNTYGSYTCDCWHGYEDLNPSRKGRSCAATFSTSTPPSSTIISTTPIFDRTSNDTITTPDSSTTSTTPVTTAAASSNMVKVTSTTLKTDRPVTSTTTQATSFRSKASSLSSVSSTNHMPPGTKIISVQCTPGYISVRVRRDYLDINNISASSLYLGQPECGPKKVFLTHVQLIAAWDKCGTRLEHNSTHNTIHVTLYNNISSLIFLMAAPKRLAVPIICTYPRSINISTGYSPTGYSDIMNDVVEGSGSFQVTVRLLNGTFPLPENYTLSPEDEVTVEVAVNTTITQIKVIINKCWATPTRDSLQPTSYLFLNNGCPTQNSHTTVIQNGNDTVSLISVKIFALVEVNIIYLHCQIQICVEIQDNTCRPTCVERASRSANLIGVTKASFGPLLRLSTTEPPSDATVSTQTIEYVLLGVGLVLFALAVIFGLLCHKRRVGSYDFSVKPPPENLTYLTFNK